MVIISETIKKVDLAKIDETNFKKRYVGCLVLTQDKLHDKTVWLTQFQISELFGTTKQNISLHIHNIFEDGELTKDSVVKDYLTTASNGKSYSTLHYNLDTIIAVGYRVKSKRGSQFRQ